MYVNVEYYFYLSRNFSHHVHWLNIFIRINFLIKITYPYFLMQVFHCDYSEYKIDAFNFEISKSIMLKVMIFFIFRIQSQESNFIILTAFTTRRHVLRCIIYFGTCRDAQQFYFSNCIRNRTTWHTLCLYCIKAILVFITFINAMSRASFFYVMTLHTKI